MIRRVFLPAAALGLMLCFVFPTLAQQAATATLSGRVTDPVGGVVVKAKVVIKQNETGVEKEVETNKAMVRTEIRRR
ncbi:MAG: hypothetical protein ABIU20_02130 [Blastocatellia bacterium]